MTNLQKGKIIMKKIVAIISLIIVLAVVTALPSFALESDVPSLALDYALDAANGVRIVKVPTAAKSPIADGDIQDGEYSYSFKEDRATHSMTNGSHSVFTEDYNSAVNCLEAQEFTDMNPLIEDTSVEYFFAQDDEYIYIGVKFHGGVEYYTDAAGKVVMEEFEGVSFPKMKQVLTRAHLIYRIGFNLDDPDEFIEINNNGARFDLTVDGVKKTFSSAGVGVDINYDGVIEQAYRQIVANETGWLNNSIGSAIVMKGDIIDQSNPATNYTVHDEIVINKEALLTCMNDYSGATYGDSLPNAFFFTASCNAQTIGEVADGVRKFTSDPGGAGYFTFNGAATNGTEVSLRAVFPDLIVFTDSEGAATKDDFKLVKAGEVVTEPEETTPAETTPTETTPAGDDQPEETTPTESAPADTEPAAKGGCGGTVSFAGLALVATLGACALVSKKRR